MIIKSSEDEVAEPERASLPMNYDWKVAESRVRQFTSEVDFSQLVAEEMKGRKPVGYVEGPPTLNGVPHIGHIRGRIMKDLWYRFSTLSKKNVVFRAGWDCQGLPVELQAEKELGLSGNKWEDLKQIGEEKMVEACKRLIAKYLVAWEEADDLLGLLLDHGRAYMTYRDSYIEREWKFLESAWNDGILGEGFKVVPYCPSCQTSLSHAEAVLGYETLEDPSLYYKVKTSDGAFLLIWTTMPFTVVTDEMVGVKPDADYAYVKMPGGEVWIVGMERIPHLAKELKLEFGETVKVVKGSELEGLHYVHPLLSMIPGLERLNAEGKIHLVVAENFVDTATGTGLVHLAPANGEEDFFVATRRKIPVFVPIDDRVCFTEEAGRFAGMFVRDSDSLVTKLLGETGNLVSEGRLEHEYPTCWRSGHRLVWVARREYFYWIDRIKADLVAAAEKVEYYFDQPRNRFIEFIRQSPPWCISRERVWGTPLPIWVCGSCKEKVPAFSRESIVRQAVALPDGEQFELHRPWIDRIVLKCPRCGGEARREPFVLDTWHNSGSAPLASFTDEERSELVPVEHLTEGIDQTRGWAYTLLVLNVIYTKRPEAPYLAFLFQGHVLDEKGRKMSKSLGNVVDALGMLRNDSVDLLRFYITWKSSPVDAVSLDLKEMDGRPYQILNTLYHLHVYLMQNGEQDGFDPARHDVAWAQEKNLLTLMDRWLLASLDEAGREIRASYSEGRYNDACKRLESQIVEVLSQGYVRMVRNELWSDAPESLDRRLAIYAMIAYALQTLDLLLHPVSPYITEYLYQEAFLAGAWRKPLLVHDFPKVSLPATAKEDKEVVDLALEVESACNSARQKAKLKRRWPLREIQVLVTESKLPQMEKARELVSLLCNVKKVSVVESVSSFPISVTLTPNRSQIGAHFKERTQAVMKAFRGLEGDEAWRAYQSGKPLTVQTDSGTAEVPISTLIFSFQGTGDWEAVARDGIMIALEKSRDDALIAEGLLRDVARRLQALRKARGYSPTAVLDRAMVAGLDEEMIALLKPLSGELNFLVRVKEVRILADKSEEGEWEEDELDGKPIYIDVS
ncbi:MAG: class I tRNA ligase family protein [Thaumarchaeota archaeon]|nr:class I tRNA ligase family protein [Nitrososphaerota archaeon]